MATRPVICLMGPTASGKTDIAMQLADRFPIDVVSVDSALVYRGMDIGTAKPDAEALRACPHRLIDVRDPEENYSAGEFVRDVNVEIDSIHGEGRIPLLAGGTMMYFRSLTEGIANLPGADSALRAGIDAEADEKGWPEMHRQLAAVDSAAAEKINPNDAQRIQRALEVFRLSGKCLTSWHEGTEPARTACEFIKIGLVPEPRSELHSRIAARFDLMLQAGFVGEMEKLVRREGLTANHTSMRAVGYRQYWSCLHGKFGPEEARSRALAATRQLAKRQLTWLRSEQNLFVVNPLEDSCFASISGYLSRRIFGNKDR